MDGNELPAGLREQLDRFDHVVPLLEYVLLRVEPELVSRLPLHRGHWEFRFELQAGELHRTAMSHVHIGNIELEAMSRRRE